MKTNLTVNTLIQANTATGTLSWKITTSEGNMRVWDKRVADVLLMNLNKHISVEVITSANGQWKNIREFYGLAETTENYSVVKPNGTTTWTTESKEDKLVVPKEVTPKEFHLSIEECRARALECVIKMDGQQPIGAKMDRKDIDECKKQFFAWIWAGKDRLTEEDSDIGDSPYN